MMEKDIDPVLPTIETLLLIESEPISVEQLASISGFPPEEIAAALSTLQDLLSHESRGIELKKDEDGWVLAPKAQYWERVEHHYSARDSSRLSKAALETLAIIAYSQPVTRAEIEAIRGVSSDSMMRFLSEKKLVKEMGRKDSFGKPLQYGTTLDFLEYFNLKSIADLPELDEIDRERFVELLPDSSDNGDTRG